ncbi:MAG TPA: response regulator transcription factor [Jiangellaceae bacterium]
MIKVLIADDHPVFLAGLAALLSATPGIDVVGRAASGDEVLRNVLTHRPDVVVLDLNMPGPGGIATIREIATRSSVRVLVLTMYDDDSLVFDAVRAGALGYVLKGAHPDEIVLGVEAVARGEAVFGTALAARMADWFARPEPFQELTPRQREVLELLAHGLKNQAIADRLGVTLKTVRNLVSEILTKLQVPDRATAGERARQAGLGRRPGTLPGPGGTSGR